MEEEGGQSTLENKLWEEPLGSPSSRSSQAETREPGRNHGAGAGVTKSPSGEARSVMTVLGGATSGTLPFPSSSPNSLLSQG